MSKYPYILVHKLHLHSKVALDDVPHDLIAIAQNIWQGQMRYYSVNDNNSNQVMMKAKKPRVAGPFIG